jgi:mRNA export factor
MAGLFGNSNAAAASTTTGDTSKDVEIGQNDLPKDSIADMQFSPTNDFLAVASWDQQVYIYEVTGNGAVGKWFFKCKGPVLSVAWSAVRNMSNRIRRNAQLTKQQGRHARSRRRHDG